MTLFGLPIDISEAWIVIIFAGGGALLSAFELRKSLTHGRVGFKGRDYRKDDDKLLFKLYQSLWIIVLFCSIAGLFGWFFDLGIKP
jgi:hypothetical protein